MALLIAAPYAARAQELRVAADHPVEPDRLAAEGLLPERPPQAPHLAPEPLVSGLPVRNETVPLVETVVFNLGTWAVDRYVLDADFARVTVRSISSNLRGGWWYDTDDFDTNQFLHPYMGSVYHTAARSSGWSFWGAMVLDFGGSLLWKIAGENGPPSINDQIMTPVGGAFLGEALFRTSRLVLGSGTQPGVVRTVGSALIAPAAAVNDVILKNKIIDPDPPPQALLGRITVGGAAARASGSGGVVRIPFQGELAFHVVHGLPEEVDPRAPFDHFVLGLDFLSATAQPWEQLTGEKGPAWLLTTRGLIVGRQGRPESGGATLYGLFGTFDYGGPSLLRVSETGLGPGIALTLRPARPLRLDATLLAAATFGSVGGRVPPTVDRDYHYGYGGHLLAEGSLWLADRLQLEASTRAYAVPAAVGGGNEELLIGKGALRLRLAGPHALGLEAIVTRRWAAYPGSDYGERAAFGSLTYSYLLGRP